MHWIILLGTSKHCFISTEFIPKDNDLIIDIITVLKDQPQASVDAAKTFLQIAGVFGAKDKKKSILLMYLQFLYFWNGMFLFILK